MPFSHNMETYPSQIGCQPNFDLFFSYPTSRLNVVMEWHERGKPQWRGKDAVLGCAVMRGKPVSTSDLILSSPQQILRGWTRVNQKHSLISFYVY